MFGFFKKKPVAETVPAAPARVATPPPPPPAPVQRSAPIVAPPPPPPSGPTLAVPLRDIVAALSPELKALAPAKPSGSAQVPLDTIQEQIGRGAVKITFANLRYWSPPNSFAEPGDLATTLVSLPLGAIIPQLPRTAMARRTDAKQMQVPEEVRSIFGARGKIIPPPVEAAPAPVAPPPTAAPTISMAPAAATPAVTAPPAASPASSTSAAPAAPPVPRAPAPQVLSSTPSAPAHSPAASPAIVAAPAPATPAGPVVQLPLAKIFEAFPAELRSSILNEAPASAVVAIPLDLIRPQLAQGSVKLSLSEISKGGGSQYLAPSGAGADAIVTLPLGLVLPQIPAGEFQRRTPSKKIEVPDEVQNLFVPKGAEPAPAVAPAPPIAAAPPADSTPTPLPVAPPVVPPPVLPATAAPATAAPEPEKLIRTSLPLDLGSKPNAPVAPAKPATPAPPPQRLASATPAPPPIRMAPAVAPTPPPATAEAVAPAAVPANVVRIEVEKVSAEWPAEVQSVFIIFPEAVLEIPTAKLAETLRLGRVEFTWAEVEPWIKPNIGSAGAAVFSETPLSLPMSTMVPLFLATSPKISGKRVDVPDSIPELFRSEQPTLPPAESSPAPIAIPSDTAQLSDSAKTSELGKLFGQPTKLQWSPGEIVKAAVSLSGVQGAVIATSDGLLVSAQLPPHLNAEAVGAFVPQLLARITQTARELKLSDGGEITVQVGQAVIYAAHAGVNVLIALGKTGTPLPTDSLNVIARELGSK